MNNIQITSPKDFVISTLDDRDILIIKYIEYVISQSKSLFISIPIETISSKFPYDNLNHRLTRIQSLYIIQGWKFEIEYSYISNEIKISIE